MVFVGRPMQVVYDLHGVGHEDSCAGTGYTSHLSNARLSQAIQLVPRTLSVS